MTTGNELLDALIRLAVALLGVAGGVLLVLRGHRLMWLFAGLSSFLLALFVLDLLRRWFGVIDNDWVRAAIAVGVGVAGGVLSRTHILAAYGVIGLASGGVLYLWVLRIVLPQGTDVVVDFWVAVAYIALLLLFMLLAAIFVIRYDEVALILLSSTVGTILITESLALDHHSEWEAALALGMALVGIIYQYHDYLAGRRAAALREAPSGEPSPTVPTL